MIKNIFSPVLKTFFLIYLCNIPPLYSTGNNLLGRDYTFLFLMTMAPEFASADYTIENNHDNDVNISIGRFPFTFDIMNDSASVLHLEIELAYQFTTSVFATFPVPGEYVDSEWDTYGLGLGLIYDYKVSEKFVLTPSARYGLARMQNDVRYHGIQTKLIKNELNKSHLFNWKTYAAVLNLGLGLTYYQKILERTSNFRAEVNRVYVATFNEQFPDIKFSENANMLALRTDLVIPSGLKLFRDNIDFIVLLGLNHFFGENHNTLGYTTSYQAGLASWLPLKWNQKKLLNIYLGGQLLWAENMHGATILFNFSLN